MSMANIDALSRCGSFRRLPPSNTRLVSPVPDRDLLEIWNRLRCWWTYILRARAYESVVGCLFEDVRAPTDNATRGERRRKHFTGYAAAIHHDSRVELDVCVQRSPRLQLIQNFNRLCLDMFRKQELVSS